MLALYLNFLQWLTTHFRNFSLCIRINTAIKQMRRNALPFEKYCYLENISITPPCAAGLTPRRNKSCTASFLAWYVAACNPNPKILPGETSLTSAHCFIRKFGTHLRSATHLCSRRGLTKRVKLRTRGKHSIGKQSFENTRLRFSSCAWHKYMESKRSEL